MNTQLVLRAVANRLVAGGACPVDRYCAHAGIERCEASSEVLEQRLAQVVEEIILKEKRPCTAWMEQHKDSNTVDKWPCAQKVWLILLPTKPEIPEIPKQL